MRYLALKDRSPTPSPTNRHGSILWGRGRLPPRRCPLLRPALRGRALRLSRPPHGRADSPTPPERRAWPERR